MLLKLLCLAGSVVCFFVCAVGLSLAVVARDAKKHRRELIDLGKKKGLNDLQQDILKANTFEFMKRQVPFNTAYLIAFSIAGVAGGLCYLLVIAIDMMG